MSTELSSDTATQASASTGVAMKFEVTALPVSDIDRATERLPGRV